MEINARRDNEEYLRFFGKNGEKSGCRVVL